MFGLILPARPVFPPSLLQTISRTQYAFRFPSQPHFSHIVIFLLPDVSLPPDTAAAVYLNLPGSTEFKLLGAIANEKQSAIFKVNIPQANQTNGIEVDMDADQSFTPSTSALEGEVTIGISVEPAAQIVAQLANLKAQAGATVMTNGSTASPGAMVLHRSAPTTKVLAQRIIKNAFNFLASFAEGGGGNEMIPLKSFRDWWTKFERRVENDPGFLERDQD
ncbi:hypothetical protein MMC25_005887 [Agyrium rufum]|nr:hypothetical protein [Agyrium rufum]